MICAVSRTFIPLKLWHPIVVVMFGPFKRNRIADSILFPVINRKPRVSFWLAYLNGMGARNNATVSTNQSVLSERIL